MTVNYARLAEIDQRDREVRDTARSQALMRAALGQRVLELPEPGQFTLEQVRELRLGKEER